MLKPSLITLLVLFQTVVHAYDVSSEKWRKANVADYQQLKNHHKYPYFVSGDFNGDGKLDEAWVMIRQDRPAWGVFLYLAGDKAPINLMEYRGHLKDIEQALVMTKAPKGTYQTACGNSQVVSCLPNEPDAVTIKSTGFILSQANSNALVFWDKRLKSFTKVDTRYKF